MKILVLDIESAGFSHEKDCILEVGMIELDLTNGKIIPLLDKTFREKHLSARHHKAWIFENGFMTLEEVRKAPVFEDVKDDIQAILDKYDNMAAWNVKFDAGFLQSRGFKLPNILPCPMITSAEYFAIPNKWGKPNKWANVNEAWVYLFGKDTGYEEIHRGFDDSKHEAEIMYELFKRGVIWKNI